MTPEADSQHLIVPDGAGQASRPGPADWLEAGRAAPRLLLIWALLPVLGIQRLRRWTGANNQPVLRVVPSDRIAARVLALRRIAARLPGCRCLARSMALSWWLARQGQAHALHIGVQGTAIDLRAHSWVEIDRQPVDDTPEVVAGFRQITQI